jgi:hypothetical protein
MMLKNASICAASLVIAFVARAATPSAQAQMGRMIYLYADRTGYLFSLKDTLDSCHFAVFSDVSGLIYQQSALTAPVVAQ